MAPAERRPLRINTFNPFDLPNNLGVVMARERQEKLKTQKPKEPPKQDAGNKQG